MTNEEQMNTDSVLVTESRALVERARAELSAIDVTVRHTPKATHNTGKKEKMAASITAQYAGELYASGKTVNEIAVSNGITYAQARKLIIDSGTPIRDASSRLKGRTRSSKASA